MVISTEVLDYYEAGDVLFTAAPIPVYFPDDLVADIAALDGVSRVSAQFSGQSIEEGCCSIGDEIRVIGIDPSTDWCGARGDKRVPIQYNGTWTDGLSEKGTGDMSGHSKWATTKYRKAAQDAKRSALFSKLSRNITVAAKEGGDPNPDNNAALAAAVAKAKSYSLPRDKIDTAIKKAFGSGSDSASFENVIYEGYGPAGVAVYIEALTDNRNRTAADVRSAFSHSGGNLGTTGSVAFQFERKGQITVEKGSSPDEDEFMMLVAEAGGDDYEDAGDEWVVLTVSAELANVRKALEDAGATVRGYELIMEPTTPTKVSVSDAKKVMRLVDRLEELEDLQNVYHTMGMTDEIAAALDE